MRLTSRIRWLDAAAAACVALVAFGLAAGAYQDVDIYWHLAVGRHVATQGALPDRNLWSYTTPEHPFAATSWLFGLGAHLLTQRFGLAGMHLAVALVIAAAFCLTYVLARRWGASPLWALGFTVAGALASESRFVPRPHAVSYLLLACTSWLLVHAWQTRRRWPLWGVPPLLALWSNIHAGAVFGVGLVGCFVLARLFEAWRAGGEGRVRRALPWAGFGLLAGLAFLANPSGLEMLRYTLFHVKSVDAVLPLTEFKTPAFPEFAPFWALLVLTLALLAWRRPRDAFGLLATLAFALLAVKAVRLVPKFAIVALPFAAASAHLAFAQARARWSGRLVRAAGPLAACAVPLVALWLGPLTPAHLLARIQLGPLPHHHPEQMAQYAEREGISGRCFASWDVTGFVEWRLPDSPVFIDPRLRAYPAELFHTLAQAEKQQEAFDALMDRYGTEWAFRGHSRMGLSGIGRFRPERWAVVYWDEAGQLLLRRGVPRFEALIQRDELRHFLPGTDPVEDFRTLQGEAHARWVTELQRVAGTSPRVHAAHTGLCLEHARRGELEAAAERCDTAARLLEEYTRFFPRAGGKARTALASAWLHLGQRAQERGLQDGARHAYARALEQLPGAVPALVQLGFLHLAQEPARAREYFERALEAEPDHPAAQKGLEQARARL